jgi:thioester reductase-like protein
VLTGATGSLGAHLLDQLLSRKDVTKVICLVRAKDDKDAMQRVEDSLKQRELSGVASRPDGSVEACASDLSLPDL